MKRIHSSLLLPLLLSSVISCKPSSTRDQYVDSMAVANPTLTTEVVAEGLTIPWSIVFTSNNRMLVAERSGRLRQIVDGTLDPTPVRQFADAVHRGEGGLMGLALDPNYASNKLLYVSYMYSKGGNEVVKIVRLTDNGANLSDDKIIFDDIPGANNHNGCRLRFGPDGKLYVTTGDAQERSEAQKTDNVMGKILRINADGTIPSDNPFGNAIWTYGHRNPQGFDWHPVTRDLYSTEHGPSTFDGRGGGDEVNLIEKGKNYGWPEISHDDVQAGMESPLIQFTPAIAPASGVFYRSNAIPEFRNNFLFGCLRGSGIMRIVFDEKDPRKIVAHQMLKEVDFGRIRDVTEGPDGTIYFSTSNQDGRGDPRPGDDKIYRIVKK